MTDTSLAPAASAEPALATPDRTGPDIVRRSRGVERLVRGQPTSDGAGVKLTRVLTQPLQRRLDPFLMLDAFGSDSASDYIGGFPDHPHRGFETVTIMKAGRMRHRDSVGNVGLLEAGSVQWMTAGRGIIHSEMPEQEEGRMAGFQLWVNLAARDKMQAPAYRDVPPGEVPRFTTPAGVAVRVVAGRSHGVTGAVTRPVTEPLVLDLELPPGSSIDIAIAPSHNAFAYSYGSPVRLGDEASGVTLVEAERMAILAPAVPQGDGGRGEPADGLRVSVQAAAPAPARVLLVAGRPLNEPIAQYGPFVMNTTDELHQAVRDYQAGVLAR
jgi:redox-sensitive bicupin YhaK (pirin superfamily)